MLRPILAGGLGLVLLLGGCDRSVGRLPPGGIAGLDGVYRGEAVLTLGRPRCAQRTPYSITVRNGNVTGEVRSPLDPDSTVGRFEAFIDSEGRIGTVARVAQEDVLIEGFFDRDRFEGSTKSNDCTTRLTLHKRAG